MFEFILLTVGGVALCIALATVIEWVAPLSPFRISDRWSGIALGLANAALIAVTFYAFTMAVGAVEIRPLFPNLGIADGALAVCGSILLADFAIYWLHRAQHRFWWRFHVVHHSPRELHASAAALSHPVEVVVRFLLMALPLVIIGIESPAVPVAVAMLIRVHEFYLHSPTTLQLGPLSRIVVNSRFHRIHHSLDERHFDRNFGVLFPFWDHLFGTATLPDPAHWPDVGVHGVEPARSLRDLLTMPFATRTSAFPAVAEVDK